MYKVLIFERKTKTVVKEMGPFDYRKATKVEAGVNINLDHDNYYTEVRAA